MMTGLENMLRSMFAAVDVSPEWFRIVKGESAITTQKGRPGFFFLFDVLLKGML